MKITLWLFGLFIWGMINFMIVPDLISDNDSALALIGFALIIVQVGVGISLITTFIKGVSQ